MGLPQASFEVLLRFCLFGKNVNLNLKTSLHRGEFLPLSPLDEKEVISGCAGEFYQELVEIWMCKFHFLLVRHYIISISRKM